MTSNLKQNTPGNSPDPEYETQGIGVSFPDPRGMKIAVELTSLCPNSSKGSYKWFSKVENMCYELTVLVYILCFKVWDTRT